MEAAEPPPDLPNLRQSCVRALERTDALPAHLRALVHEYGFAIVHAMVEAGVRDPQRIHHLVHEVWAGARQPNQRTGRRHSKRSPVLDQLDWLLVQAGSEVTAETLVRVLNQSDLIIIPCEPSARMVAASLDATNHMGRVTKEQKHRNRLRSALKAAKAHLWPHLVR